MLSVFHKMIDILKIRNKNISAQYFIIVTIGMHANLVLILSQQIYTIIMELCPLNLLKTCLDYANIDYSDWKTKTDWAHLLFALRLGSDVPNMCPKGVSALKITTDKTVVIHISVVVSVWFILTANCDIGLSV